MSCSKNFVSSVFGGKKNGKYSQNNSGPSHDGVLSVPVAAQAALSHRVIRWKSQSDQAPAKEAFQNMILSHNTELIQQLI